MAVESQVAACPWRISSQLKATGQRRLARRTGLADRFAIRDLLTREPKLGENLKGNPQGLGVIVPPYVVGMVIEFGAKIIPRSDCGLRIGSGSKIGAGAVVTNGIPKDCTAIGAPARFRPRGPARL
jgi:hypothetical protein